jgi:hypothetical protein
VVEPTIFPLEEATVLGCPELLDVSAQDRYQAWRDGHDAYVLHRTAA